MLTQGQAGRLRTRGPRLAADDGVRHRSRGATANPECEERRVGILTECSQQRQKLDEPRARLFLYLKSRLLADARTSWTLVNPRTSAGGRRWSPSPESLRDCESRLRIPTARSAELGFSRSVPNKAESFKS